MIDTSSSEITTLNELFAWTRPYFSRKWNHLFSVQTSLLFNFFLFEPSLGSAFFWFAFLMTSLTMFRSGFDRKSWFKLVDVGITLNVPPPAISLMVLDTSLSRLKSLFNSQSTRINKSLKRQNTTTSLWFTAKLNKSSLQSTLIFIIRPRFSCHTKRINSPWRSCHNRVFFFYVSQ